MAISIDTTITITHNITAFDIDLSGGAKLVLVSKPTGRQAQTTKITLTADVMNAILDARPADSSRSRIDELEHAFLVYLRDNGYL